MQIPRQKNEKNGLKTVFFCILHYFAHYMIMEKALQSLSSSKSDNCLFRKSRHYYPPPPTTGTREALMEPLGTIWNAAGSGTRISASPLTLKCVNFVNFVNFWKGKSHRAPLAITRIFFFEHEFN